MRTVLIIHEPDAAGRAAKDVAAVATVLRARGLAREYGHVALERGESPEDGSSVRDWNDTFETAIHTEEDARRDADARRDDVGRPVPCGSWLVAEMATSRRLEDVDVAAYAGVIVCDHGAFLDTLSHDAAFARIVDACDAANRPIGAIARAPFALAELVSGDGRPYVRGRRITCAGEAAEAEASTDRVRVDAESAACGLWALWESGATVCLEPSGSEHVVVDAYLVTAQNVRSAASAARTLAVYVEPLARLRLRAS
ncbi:MAG: hypothetical protein NVSMB59_18520 [Vulcanimicrobiaceae bacterium]